MKYLLLTLLLLTGCAGFSDINWNPGPPSDAIIMSDGDEIKINSMTNKTDGGTPINRFHCATGLMVCKQYANTKFCSCHHGEIILPISMGF